MYTGKMCHNSIMGGHINIIVVGSQGDDPNECGIKWLPWQRPLNLILMASYFKNENVFKLLNKHIHTSRHSITWTNFGKRGQRTRSHGHIM